jgi:hypothetical protein
MTTETQLDLTADMIDVRDIIARVEDLESVIDTAPEDNIWTLEEQAEANRERIALEAILDELKGYGGDEQWRGDWYPVTLIRGRYFTDYVRELLEDCGDVPRNLPHYIAIDWETTARNVRTDYTPVLIESVAYWYR